MRWNCSLAVLPQLDHTIEVEGSANGDDQGYSGWVELDDGRIFVVHHTDDTAPACIPDGQGLGVPWIRGTFLALSDLPPGAQGGAHRTKSA